MTSSDGIPVTSSQYIDTMFESNSEILEYFKFDKANEQTLTMAKSFYDLASIIVYSMPESFRKDRALYLLLRAKGVCVVEKQS